MDCRDAEDLLIRRQDNQTSPAEERLLDEHLTHCSGCRQFHLGLEKTQKLLERERSAQPRPVEPSALWERVSAALTEPASPSQLRRGWMPAALAGAAAALAASVLVAVGLWRWGVGMQRDMDELRDAHAALRLRYDELQTQAVPPRPTMVSLASADLERSGRLYQKLADFYRLPVLWVAEGERGAEMKLGVDELTTDPVSAPADLLFLRVSVSDSQDPSFSTALRLVSRPGQHVSVTLDGLVSGQGRWWLECVPDVGEAGRVTVALRLRYTDGPQSAALGTQLTLAPGSAVRAGSLVVEGRLYVVEVFGQRAPIPHSEPELEAEARRI